MDDSKLPPTIRPKLETWDFWKAIGSPRYVLAPMVDASELPFRLLCRKYGTELCYSPMMNQNTFTTSQEARDELWQTCPEERPVFVQLAGDDPMKLLQAAKYVEHECDAIDVNFGCPQSIARRGNYGAFLQDQWDTVRSIVSTLHQHCRVPVTCKFRKHFTMERTIGFAEMLVEAGAQVLCMHGRTRLQRGLNLGLADWEAIRIVRDRVPTVPFISNGNILNMDHVEACFKATNCQAVMSAETIRRNPALFSGRSVPARQLCDEYIEIYRQHPVHITLCREHIHRMNLTNFDLHFDLRDELMHAPDADAVARIVHTLDHRIQNGIDPPKPPTPPPLNTASPEDTLAESREAGFDIFAITEDI